MAVPDFRSFFRPLSDYLSDGEEHGMAAARDAWSKSMAMSEEDLREFLPGGIHLSRHGSAASNFRAS